MAVMNCHFYSTTLKQPVDVNVFIPTPEENERTACPCGSGYPVLYLLHGAFGDYSSWMHYSNIERYARKHCCAVVMPSGENSFYQDMYRGKKYFTFFTEELTGFIKNMFPVSRRREDTFAAGFSMGGYGAWYLALRRPDIYAKAASLSGCLDIGKTYEGAKVGLFEGPFLWEEIFEDPKHLTGGPADILPLYDRCAAGGDVPGLYFACGTEDFLYEMNRAVKRKLEERGADFVFEEGRGHHSWNFWDKYIQNALDWMLPRK